ncbi:hypothetical protein QEG73_01060 [Chitinophagaceae bacterium 26-R-25]|nr:hypothetical protein [Chitinophagaceae bacterium 26-R-25]
MEKNVVTTDWTKVSELEIIYKAKIKVAERPKIKMSSDVYNLFLATSATTTGLDAISWAYRHGEALYIPNKYRNPHPSPWDIIGT